MYVDSHAHIDTKEFDNDRDYIVNECEIIIVNAGIDIESNIKSLTLEKKYKNVIAAVGFHPEFVKDHLEQVEKCLELVDKAKIVSEIGLDYFWIKEQELRRKQIEILSLFLNKAEKQRKPAIIHVRGGMNDFLNMISSYKVKFVIHAFEGNVKTANKVIELGGMVSIPPVLVRDKQRQEVVKNIDLDYILTETDSPFLGPEKMSRNKPCNVVYTIRKISELKGVDEKEVIKKIEDNFKKLIS
ncbi:MAG: TatD family hydrolase [Sulfolobus sp.]